MNPKNMVEPAVRRRRALAAWGMLAVAGIFVVGLAQLFSWRFAAGEGYPPGSSRRSDPRGTRVFYDSLSAVPGFRVERNFESLARLVPDPAGATLFLFGYDSELLSGPIPKSVADELDDFARRGGRVVLALEYAQPAAATNAWAEVSRLLRRGGAAEEGANTRVLAKLWGFQLEKGTGAGGEAIQDGTFTTLPSRIPWPGARRFDGLGDSWRVVYARDGEAVVVQRPLGQGSVVLLADDFLTSNEALRQRRETQLLTWLLGGNRRVVFDETHLGLTQDPGLAGLVGRYHLGGAVLGLLLLAGLYLWQQAVPFLPRRALAGSGEGPEGGPAVAGRASAAGFRNLLRRSVPQSELPLLRVRASGSQHHQSVSKIEYQSSLVCFSELAGRIP